MKWYNSLWFLYFDSQTPQDHVTLIRATARESLDRVSKLINSAELDEEILLINSSAPPAKALPPVCEQIFRLFFNQ